MRTSLSVAAWLLFFVSFCLLGFHPIAESDVFMYLALARNFFAHGHFAATDPFIASLPNTEWDILHEWASYLLFYGSYVVAGFAGVTFLKIIIAMIAWAPAVWRVGQRKLWGSFWHFTLFFLGLLAFSLRYTERAALLADALLALVVATVFADERGSSKIRWALPAIFLVWMNVHPSYPLGFLICGVWLLSALLKRDRRAFRQRLAPVFASGAVIFLNPLGVDGVTYPFRFLQFKNQLLRSTNHEWSHSFTPELFQFHEVWFFFAFLLLAISLILISVIRSRGPRPWLALLLSFLFLYFGLSANRFISATVLVLLLVSLELELPSVKFPRAAGWISATASLLLTVAIWTGTYRFIGFPIQLRTGVDARIFPTQNIERLKNYNTPGSVWNSFYFGCYLSWVLEEKRPIAIHGFVTDMQYLLRFYSAIIESRARFDETVEKMNIHAFLLVRQPTAIPFLEMMKDHPQWRLAGEDEASLLFLRR